MFEYHFVRNHWLFCLWIWCERVPKLTFQKRRMCCFRKWHQKLSLTADGDVHVSIWAHMTRNRWHSAIRASYRWPGATIRSRCVSDWCKFAGRYEQCVRSIERVTSRWWRTRRRSIRKRWLEWPVTQTKITQAKITPKKKNGLLRDLLHGRILDGFY